MTLLPIQTDIWEAKYRFVPSARVGGLLPDEHIPATWRRVARALSAPEGKDQALWEDRFYSALENFQYLPAGRIIAGAGTERKVTLFNCLSPYERFYSLERGLSTLGECVGETLSVWTKKGWRLAQIREFGVQETNIVTLTPAYESKGAWRVSGRGKFARQITATPSHRWILQDGRETTNLREGDTIAACARPTNGTSPAYYDGFCHGVIFGDGTYVDERRIGSIHSTEWHHLHTIRLCGRKAELLPFFESGTGRFTKSHPPSANGDPVLSYYRERSCKALPSNEDALDYIAGFIEGWMAVDGAFGTGGPDTQCICTQNAEAAEWLKAYAPLAGFVFIGSSDLNTVGYGNRKSPCQYLRLKPAEKVAWKVTSIKPGEAQPVYCAVVEGEHAFMLEGGVYTGNCFVMGRIPDSIAGIFQAVKESAETLQQGGGIGNDFSTIRPKGAPVVGVGADASGPLSFMDVWDAMCKTMMAAGARRGAMMGTLRCDHPDIEAFIEAKRDPLRFRNFNLSVLVTDAFMKAIDDDAPWDLIFDGKGYKQIRARELWHKIMRSAYDSAEPGVIFIDRINKTNNLAYCENISATNPCAEQPLPPYGACLLGSINLTRFVREPFSEQVYFDMEAALKVTRLAVRMMDNVIEVSNYPLKEQAIEAHNKRRIGLGITGLADALAMCMVHYGSQMALNTAASWMEQINDAAYRTSVDLAYEKGQFPLFKPEHGQLYFDRDGAAIRNGTLTSIAPTGTISLFAGNISSGVEPIFDYDFQRNVLQADGSMKTAIVEDYAVRLWRDMHPSEELPSYFVRAGDLTPQQHLDMQAALQKHVDTSISKTINCPEDIPFVEFKSIYRDAYKKGLKVCAVYRPNSITGSVLSPISPSAEDPTKDQAWLGRDRQGEAWHGGAGSPPSPELIKKVEPMLDEGQKRELLDLVKDMSDLKTSSGNGAAPPMTTFKNDAPPPRDHCLDGRTYKIKWPPSEHALYITINNHRGHGSSVVPYEIFINTKNPEHHAWTTAFTRMVSAIWRRGGDCSFIVDELRAIVDPRGGNWMDGRYVPSLQAAIGDIIDKHVTPVNPVESVAADPRVQAGLDEYKLHHGSSPATGVIDAMARAPAYCPRCGGTNVFFPKAKCLTCHDCDYSNCE